MTLKEVKLKEWTQNMKEWNQIIKECTMKSYLLIKIYIAYVILPPSTKMTEDPIDAPCDGTT